jgi:hypothetical protein
MSGKVKRAKVAVIPLRRPYKETILALVMFGGCAAFFYVRASNNDRGLILNGIIEMGPAAADWFYAILGLLSAAMALAGLFGAWRIWQIKDFYVDLGRKEMTFPSAPVFRTPLVTVPYDRIDSVEIVGEGSNASVIIREGDRAYSIPGRWIGEGWTAPQILEEVIARVRTIRTKIEELPLKTN